jgi:A/G-specific adenine glycosylase
MKFSDVLLEWYDLNQRDLPWRSTDNPYVIWIAEVVFQQTRISQGMPYFLSFIEEFPSVHHLAVASEENVLKKWQGLGYYSRARNLQYSAKYIVNELGGEMPSSYQELLKLKGVGPYIAAEVASVCFKEVVAAVDGNVQRVLSRYFGVEEPVNSGIGAKLIQALANENISETRPGDFNQALMDLGSSICSPKKPDCGICVFADSCWALRNDETKVLPIKLKKVKVKDRYFNYFIISKTKSVLLHKREAGDVWQGLYQPPLIETIESITDSSFEGQGYLLSSVKRVLSHQRIHISYWVVNELPEAIMDTGFQEVSLFELTKYPVPKSIEQLFSSLEFASLFNGVD